MSFKLVIGCKKWEHKPKGNEVAVCQNPLSYIVKEATTEQFFKWVCEGRCWRAGTLKEGAHNFKKTSFVGSRVFALDFDECESTPEDICEYAKQLQVEPNFFYYSFSQGTKPNYNFRLVWVFNDVMSVETYEMLYKSLLRDEVFSQADKATKDISRLWFGTNKGGTFLNGNEYSLDAFNIFKYEIEEVENDNINANYSITYLKDERDQTIEEDDFVLPLVKYGNTNEQACLPWIEYLRGKCDLWDKWEKGEYLHYHQRLLLFTELKKLKYPEDAIKNHSILDDVMRFYDAELYEGSKCCYKEIRYFLTNRTTKATNPIVGGKWTIAEFFNSGAYLCFKQEKKRISREQLQAEADKVIKETLASNNVEYVELQTEAGKTERILNYLRNTVDLTQTKVIYTVPRYLLLDEFVLRAEEKGISRDTICYPHKINYTAEDLYYLNAGFPQGIEITDEMRARRRDLQRLRDRKDKGLYLITHSCLSHMNGIEADEIIIDENIEDCLIRQVRIHLTALNALTLYLKAPFAKSEMRAFIERIEQTPDNTEVKAPNWDLIFQCLDYRAFVKDQRIDDDGKKDIGLLQRANVITVNRDWNGYQYIYFEIRSDLFENALKNSIKLKLFTGTSKINTLRAGYGDEIMSQVNYVQVERAEQLGQVLQCRDYSGSKWKIEQALKGAIEKFQKLGIDWQRMPLLTLKSAVDTAKQLGYKIPQRISSEGEQQDLYIENCAGLDCLKGQDLIVIGKVDIPKNAYVDMVHKSGVDTTMSKTPKIIPDTGETAMIYSFIDNDLWKLQYEKMRESIEQATGRGRNLWYDNTVYVFCDFPVRSKTQDF